MKRPSLAFHSVRVPPGGFLLFSSRGILMKCLCASDFRLKLHMLEGVKQGSELAEIAFKS